METTMSKKLVLLFVLALFVGIGGVFAQEDVIVFYHGEQITFQDLEERGIITHCMDDISQAGAGVVLCFDSREERNAAFEDVWRRESAAESVLAGTLFFYRYPCYGGGIQYTVPPDQLYVSLPADSIGRDGQIAVEVFRLPILIVLLVHGLGME
jgi:hypothetical protein